MNMADRLRQRRKSLHLSQAKLAEMAGTTQQMVQQLEARKVRTTGKLVALAEALGVRPKWLETGEQPMIEVITVAERELLDGFREMENEEREAYLLLFRRRRKGRNSIVDPFPHNDSQDERRTA